MFINEVKAVKKIVRSKGCKGGSRKKVKKITKTVKKFRTFAKITEMCTSKKTIQKLRINKKQKKTVKRKT